MFHVSGAFREEGNGGLDTTIEAILEILPILIGVGMGLLLVLVHTFNGLLMNEHRETWEQIGSPRLLGMKWSWNKFVWRLEYRSLGNRRLTLLGHTINVITILCAVGLIAGAILNSAAK